MKTTFKILTVLAGAFITLSGLLFLIKPELGMEHAQLSANDAFGLGTVRGIIGGSMLAAGLSGILAIARNKPSFLHTAALVCAGWSVGRIVSLFADGFAIGTVVGLSQSLIFAAIFTISFKVLTKKSVQS